jgi:hypothetical protein
MNSELLKSKKFRAAVLAAVSSLLSFLVAKLGLGWNVEEIMTLISTLLLPILFYIGAEGYSEVEAKRVVEENKIRKELSDQVLGMVTKEKSDET